LLVRVPIAQAEIADLSKQLDFDSGVAETLRDVFLRRCPTRPIR
jgi:hypothetical protein